MPLPKSHKILVVKPVSVVFINDTDKGEHQLRGVPTKEIKLI